MKHLLFALLLFACSCSQQITRVNPRIGDSPVYIPKYEVGRAILPGMLGLIGGVMYTGTTKGRIVQQGMFFGAAVSIGAWPQRPVKFHLIDLGVGLGGAALGFTLKNQMPKKR